MHFELSNILYKKIQFFHYREGNNHKKINLVYRLYIVFIVFNFARLAIYFFIDKILKYNFQRILPIATNIIICSIIIYTYLVFFKCSSIKDFALVYFIFIYTKSLISL